MDPQTHPGTPWAGPHSLQGVFHALAPLSWQIPEAVAGGRRAGRLQGREAFAPEVFYQFDKAGAKGCDLSCSSSGQFPLLWLPELGKRQEQIIPVLSKSHCYLSP